jgi:hypothetical protein
MAAMVNERVSGLPQSIRRGTVAAAYSEYYWVGYALALLVAEAGASVQKVVDAIPPREWLRLYLTHHEYGDELLLAKLTEIAQTQR